MLPHNQEHKPLFEVTALDDAPCPLRAEEVMDALQDHIISVLVVNITMAATDQEAVALEQQLQMDVHISSQEVCAILLHSRQSVNDTFLALAPPLLSRPN